MLISLLLIALCLSLTAPVHAQRQSDVTFEPDVRIDSGFVEVDHGRLYYEVTGTGEPVVLIHGNFGDRRYWDDQIAALSTKYRVLRYDVRGFGKSSLPIEGLTYSNHSDLADLLRHLNISSAHIVGFSMGSGIAIDFVLAYPAMTKSLVSVGPWVSGYSSEAAQEIFRDFAEMDSVLKVQGASEVVDYAMTKTFLDDIIRDQGTESRVKAIIDDFTWWYFTQENSRLPLKPAAVERTGEIAVPTLIVTTEYDIPACLEIADLLEQTVPNSQKVEFAEAGHFMMIDKPEQFNHVLLNFLMTRGRSTE